VEQVKNELRGLNSGNQKRKWNNLGTSSESATPSIGSAESHPLISTKPCRTQGRKHHTIIECRVGTNKCI